MIKTTDRPWKEGMCDGEHAKVITDDKGNVLFKNCGLNHSTLAADTRLVVQAVNEREELLIIKAKAAEFIAWFNYMNLKDGPVTIHHQVRLMLDSTLCCDLVKLLARQKEQIND